MNTGICRNAACENARNAKPVELYAGPGEYCPGCGEALEPVAPGAATPESIAPAPFGGLSALEALSRFDVGESSLETPVPLRGQRSGKRVALIAASVAVAVVAAAAVLRPTAAQRTTVANATHVCRSSMTERLAADVVYAYAEKTGVPRTHFDLTQSGPCDVRFTAKRTAKATGVLGYDGIVVVVNPQNPLTRMTQDDVRLIFSGAITDWSEFGEAPGRIVPIMPAAGSDEADALTRTLLAHSAIATGVRRAASSEAVVRAVVSPGNRSAIGLVAFSAAVPAKVIALPPLPAPSFLSIGDRRYALSVTLTVDAKSRTRAAAGLAAFARSADAQAIVFRDGFVPNQGV